MNLIQERQIIPRCLGVQITPWNLDGYRGYSAPETSIFELDLGEVKAAQVIRRRLLALERENDAPLFSIFEDYPPTIELSPQTSYGLKLHKFGTRSFALENCADLQWSNFTDVVYVLDFANARVLRFKPTDAQLGGPSELEALDLRLPRGVELSAESRLALIERSPERPEDLDPILFITAPESGVLLELNLQSRSPAVVAGKPGRRGRPQDDVPSTETLLRFPTSLAADADTSSVFFVDDARYIYRHTKGGRVQLISKLPREMSAGAIAIYRLSNYVDTSQLDLLTLENRDWGSEPVLLLFLEQTSGYLHKIPLRDRNRKRQRLFAPACRGAHTILPLVSGHLLLPTLTGVSYHIAQKWEFPSSIFSTHMVS